MRILWLTWKDFTHPDAGGAEIVLRELSKRLIEEGHGVTFLTVRHPGSAAKAEVDGIEIVRVGNSRYTHSFQALAYYLMHMRNHYDIIVEVVNTAPYFASLFKGKSRAYVFYHQLAREVWFHELKNPFCLFGYYFMEPVATRLMSRAKAKMITVSQSTLKDLERFGFKAKNASIISEGIEIQPISSLNAAVKFKKPTMLSLGAIRPMKRTLDQVRAYEKAKRYIPGLRLVIAGQAEGAYADSVLKYISQSPYAGDIIVEGQVSVARKQELMRGCHLVIMTSVKEGWGLVVTEAASQGTPAVVYDVDGLRDSVRHNETGIVCENNPDSLATGIVTMLIDRKRYTAMRHNAWEWSKSLNFDHSYNDFKQALELA